MEYQIHELLSLVQDDQVELASGAGTEAVRERVMAQVRPARRRPLRKLVLAAAAAAMLVVSACAAAYYTGGWQLFETEKALAAAEARRHPTATDRPTHRRLHRLGGLARVLWS